MSPASEAVSHCIDIHSHIVSQGLHYVPGPNSCTVCICDKGSPKWCKSVLCSPPQDCQSFQLGNSCCEYKCLDDILGANGPGGGNKVDVYGSGVAGGGSGTSGDTYDVALRLIASLVTAVLSLSLFFFLIHRLRQRKSRHRAVVVGGPSHGHQLSDDHRHHHGYNGIGYITGSLGYLSGSVGYLGSPPNDCDYPYNETGYPLWKPAGGGGYFPRGEAPPPYEEAVRAARAEASMYGHHHQQQQQQQTACDAGGGNPVSLTLVHNTHVNITQQQQQRADDRIADHQQPDGQQQSLLPSVQPQLRLVCRQSKSLLVNQVDVHSEAGVPIVVLPAGGGRKRAVTTTTARRMSPLQQSGLLIGTQSAISVGQVTRREPRAHRTIPATVQTAPVIVDAAVAATARNLRTRQIRSQPAPLLPPPPLTSAAAAVTRRPADDSDLDDYRSECENCKSLSLENCSDELLNETMTLQRHPAEPAEPQPPFYRTSLTLPVHCKKLRTLNAAHRDSWFTPMQELSSSSDEE